MKSIRWILGLATCATLVLVLSLGTRAIPPGSAGDKPANDAAIKIDNFSFGPPTITIAAGTTVIWTNHDDVPHVVTSDDNKLFKSKPLDTDDRFSFTFTKPGTYNYYCAIHPKMTAKIVVQ